MFCPNEMTLPKKTNPLPVARATVRGHDQKAPHNALNKLDLATFSAG
jgi:hypothetical protein